MTFTLLPFHRFRDAVRRGDSSRATSRFQEAIDAYTEAMVVRGGDLTPDQESDLRVRIAECSLETGDLSSADVALAPAENLDPARVLPGTQGAVMVVRARIALYRGDYAGAVEIAGAAWDILRQTGENSRVARALTVRGHGHYYLGDLEAAREDYGDALAAARRADDQHEVGLAASNLGFLLWKSGHYLEARRFHTRAVEIHEKTGSEAHLTRELFALSVDEFHAGDWSQVDALLTRCEERAGRTDDRRLLSGIEIARGRLELQRGQDPRERLEAAARNAEAEGYANDIVMIGELLGDAAIERGDWSEAHRRLVESHERAVATAPDGEPSVDVAWRLALVEEALGDPEGSSLVRLEGAARTARERGYRFQEGQVRRTLGQVLSGGGRRDEAEKNLEASLRIFRDLKTPFETGRSLMALAAFLAEYDEAGEALAASRYREAEALFAKLGAEREGAKAAEGLAVVSGEGVSPAAGGAVGGAGGRGADRDPSDPFFEIATVASTLEEAIGRARRIAPSNIPVLLTGETGTGKELFARAIHQSSHRAGAPFLAINCAALSESLLEAELFGYVKGAFTGAAADRVGIFEAAEGGTVFLDEIGKAPLSLQAKLLRVLDTGEVRRVGGVDALHVDVRIVAATNRALPGLVHSGDFLPDLLYRLRGYEIGIPPLREREGDVAHLFARFAGRRATTAALELLESHDWPGNVREIRNLAESTAFLTFGNGPIPADALPDWLRRSAIEKEAVAAVATAEAALSAATPAPPPATLRETERDALVRALTETGGNRSAAARALRISRQTLYTKMSKYGIGRADAA